METTEKRIDHKCKLCSIEFKSIKDVLKHELIHMVNGTATKRRKRSGNSKGRKRRKDPKVISTEVNVVLAELEDELRDGLSNCAEGTELNFLCRLFQPDPENLSLLYNGIVRDLHSVLSNDEQAGSWDIQAFGSTITGMAFKDSDMDFYIQPMMITPFKRQFNRVHGLLCASRIFSNIIPIRQARVPIIKCKHESTGINLDINMSSAFGIYNSRFISKIFMFDNRIHPLMLILKIWAKSWEITKSGRLTNYCLILLIIFYLQNCPEPILPPLQRFQEGIDPQFFDSVNFAFNQALENRTRNEDNIKQLVNGFFLFYAQMDFARVLICPYNGKALNRFEFASGLLPFPEYNQQLMLMRSILENEAKTKRNGWNRDIRSSELNTQTLMVVQDPFCLNNNTAKAVTPHIFELFMRQILHGNTICKESESSSELLLRLFYEKSPVTENVSPTAAVPPAPSLQQQVGDDNQPISSNKKIGKFTCRLSPMETELFYIRLNLRKFHPEKSFSKLDIDKFWCECAVRFTKQILIELFKLSYDATGINTTLNVDGELSAYADTWTGRKYDSKKIPDAFLKEQQDFGEIFAKERNSDDQIIHCTLKIQTQEPQFNAISITMEAKPTTTKKILQALFNDLTPRIRVFFKAFFEKLAKEKL